MSTRIDKWLWHARFYRTRVLAQSAAGSGRIRLNGRRVEKACNMVKQGDVLTLPIGGKVIVLRVCAEALRRDAAAQARSLYEIIEDTALEQRAAAPYVTGEFTES